MKLIKDETELFNYIDPDFKNWNVDEGVTDSVPLKVVKQEKNFKFSDVFNDTHYCSQEDVINWVKENKDEIIKTGYAYFFPIKNSGGARFVADVFEWDGELKVDVYGLSFDYVWNASDGRVVLFPQRTLNTQKETLSNLDTLTLERAIGICVMNGYNVTKNK